MNDIISLFDYLNIVNNLTTRKFAMNDKQEALSNIRNNSEEAVENLSLGFTAIYQPTLKSLRTQLLEITKKQEFVIDELKKENLRLSETINSDEFQKMFLKIKLYRDKLSLIKRDMMIVHERSTKLKVELSEAPPRNIAGKAEHWDLKRALKLEQQKQKEALEKIQKREYEELLISKPSTS